MGDVCKLILIGNGSVGKSSIINRFKDDGFERVYKQTVGLDFFEKLITLRGDKRMRLQVWDIGGQSVGSPMLPKYIYGSQAVMICYDVTDPRSFADCEDWLRLARKTLSSDSAALLGKKPCKLLLVGNKIDLMHLRKVDEAQHQRFVQEHKMDGGCFVSAQSGENVLKAFYKCAAEVAGVQLSAYELAFHDRVLGVSVTKGGEDDWREGLTPEQQKLEEEDRAAEAARRERMAKDRGRKSKKKRCSVQ